VYEVSVRDAAPFSRCSPCFWLHAMAHLGSFTRMRAVLQDAKVPLNKLPGRGYYLRTDASLVARTGVALGFLISS
jgi:hypothetical protein